MPKIKAIAYYIPEKKLSNEELSQQFPEWSVEKISSKTGIYNRPISAFDEFTSDMAVKAAQNIFTQYDIKPADIDYILLCTQSPDYWLPTTACIVQDKLGIPTSAGALDFNLGCSGYVYGLSLAKGLIAAKISRNVLLITSETYTKHIHNNDKSNRTIFADGASATVIADNGLFDIGDFVLGTDGRGAENLIIKRGAGKYPLLSNQEVSIDEYGNSNHENYLQMNGTEIFNFSSEFVPKLFDATLQKNHLSLEDIDLVIFHQANKYMLNHLRKKIGIDENKFFYMLENFGNTVSSTIPIALKEALSQNIVKPGMNILLAGFGVGYSWSGVVIKS